MSKGRCCLLWNLDGHVSWPRQELWKWEDPPEVYPVRVESLRFILQYLTSHWIWLDAFQMADSWGLFCQQPVSPKERTGWHIAGSIPNTPDQYRPVKDFTQLFVDWEHALVLGEWGEIDESVLFHWFTSYTHTWTRTQMGVYNCIDHTGWAKVGLHLWVYRTEFMLLLSCITYCIVFHTNTFKPIFARPCIYKTVTLWYSLIV